MGRTRKSSDKLLSLRLLGPPEIQLGQRPFPSVPSRKTIALLIYLVVESNRIHGRQALSTLLWPEATDAKALASLRQSLFALRRVLESVSTEVSFLTISPRTVQFHFGSSLFLDLALLEAPPPECRILEDPESCDRCARHLTSLAELIRGPFLEGFVLQGCEEFNNWVEGVRERIKTQAIRVIERLVRFKMAEGDLKGLIRITSRGLRIDPYDERAHRRLMRLLAATGDLRAAELQFEACRNLLLREIGVPPDPETLALLKEIQESQTKWRDHTRFDSSDVVERGPVTALFFDGHCDHSEGDASSRPGIRTLCNRIPELIHACGGVPLRSHGGTYLAWFGFGPFREGAARRAAQAAFDLADLFRREADVTVRAGLHTGIVTVEGQEIPESAEEVERVAMSLCMQANNGELLVSRSTLLLLADQFRLKPASGKVPAGSGGIYRLLGFADGESTNDFEVPPSMDPVTGQRISMASP